MNFFRIIKWKKRQERKDKSEKEKRKKKKERKKKERKKKEKEKLVRNNAGMEKGLKFCCLFQAEMGILPEADEKICLDPCTAIFGGSIHRFVYF